MMGMNEQKRYMTTEDINFIVNDLRGVLSCIAGHIQIILKKNESVIELRTHTTLIAGSIAEMNDRKNKLFNRRDAYRKLGIYRRNLT